MASIGIYHDKRAIYGKRNDTPAPLTQTKILPNRRVLQKKY